MRTEQAANLYRSIQAACDTKKLAALIDELIGVLDEEGAINAEIDIQADAVTGI
jgi:hypothetical protein